MSSSCEVFQFSILLFTLLLTLTASFTIDASDLQKKFYVYNFQDQGERSLGIQFVRNQILLFAQ